MKRKLALGLIAIFAFLNSCKKETKQITTTIQKPTLKSNTVQLPPYVDMDLLARQPGETWDTYHATWHGCDLYITGSPVWDMTKYPALVNGVPTFSDGIGTRSTAVSVDYSNLGPDGSVFSVTQSVIGNIDFKKFHDDQQAYIRPLSAWENAGMDPQTKPFIYSYIPSTYSNTSNQTVQYVGKLIRVTTGTHWAITEINYPLPSETPSNVTFNFGAIPDNERTNISYDLTGKNGLLISGKQYTNGGSPVPVTVTGHYYHVNGDVNWHFVGTIWRVDGTVLRLDQTVDLS